MRFETATSPHIHDSPTVSQIMRRVLYALLPGVAVLVWLFGGGVLVHMAIAAVVALAAKPSCWRSGVNPSECTWATAAHW